MVKTGFLWCHKPIRIMLVAMMPIVIGIVAERIDAFLSIIFIVQIVATTVPETNIKNFTFN